MESSTSAERFQDLASFLRSIATYVSSIGGYVRVSVMLNDPDPSCLFIKGWAGLSSEYVERWNSARWMAIDETNPVASVRSFITRQTVVIPDTLRDRGFTPPWVNESEAEGYRAVAATPLLDSGGNAIGALAVFSQTPRDFSSTDTKFLESVAGLAARAVESRRAGDRLASILEAFEYAYRLHRTLLRLDEIQEVVDEVAHAMGIWVGLAGSDGTAWPDPPVAAPRPPLRRIREAVAAISGLPIGQVGGSPRDQALVGIQIRDPDFGPGFLLAEPIDEVSDVALRLNLGGAALVIERIQTERRRMRRIARERESELVDSLIHGYFGDSDHLRARAAEMGVNLDARHAAVLISAQTIPGGQSDADQLWQTVLRRLSRPGTWLRPGARGRRRATLIIAEGHPANPAEHVWQLTQRLDNTLPLLISAGSYTTLDSLEKSYSEARDAQRILTALGVHSGHLWYPGSGALGILAASSASARALRAAQATLGPLTTHDQRHGGNLLPTLRDYFRLGQNVKRTAESQYVHLNSVYNRLAKIQQLTGLSLDQQSDRLQLELSLLVLDLDTAGDPAR